MREIKVTVLILASFLFQVVSFISLNSHQKNTRKVQSRCPNQVILYISDSSQGFDSDFANSISKPLPDWYYEQQRSREALLKEEQEKRQRSIEEFRRRYELTNEEKAKELELRKAKRKSKKINIFQKAFGMKDIDEELDDESLSTKEKWDNFLAEEEKSTGLKLPGFFEVFPELNFKWPKWAKKRDGSILECETDEDCLFPQACCPHPIIPTKKFCCTGWGQRIMIPKFVGQEAIAQTGPRGGADARDPIDPRKVREPWRPETD
jgi:hypothetical protein